jgi:hypothetical protein
MPLGGIFMNTRFRRPLQAAALLFSLSLFIGYLCSAQRRSGLPSIAAFPATAAGQDQIEHHADGSFSITFGPDTLAELEGFIHFGKPIQPGSPAAPFMPGSKNISQPVFSTRRATSDPTSTPVMPGSKLGIFALPAFSLYPASRPGSLMSSSKSGRVFTTEPLHSQSASTQLGTITKGEPMDQIHLVSPPVPTPSAAVSDPPEKTTP